MVTATSQYAGLGWPWEKKFHPNWILMLPKRFYHPAVQTNHSFLIPHNLPTVVFPPSLSPRPVPTSSRKILCQNLATRLKSSARDLVWDSIQWSSAGSLPYGTNKNGHRWDRDVVCCISVVLCWLIKRIDDNLLKALPSCRGTQRKAGQLHRWVAALYSLDDDRVRE